MGSSSSRTLRLHGERHGDVEQLADPLRQHAGGRAAEALEAEALDGIAPPRPPEAGRSGERADEGAAAELHDPEPDQQVLEGRSASRRPAGSGTSGRSRAA